MTQNALISGLTARNRDAVMREISEDLRPVEVAVADDGIPPDKRTARIALPARALRKRTIGIYDIDGPGEHAIMRQLELTLMKQHILVTR